MDPSIAASILLFAVGTKFAFDAILLLRSKEVRAIEDRIKFYEKMAPITKSDSRRFTFALGLCSYCLAWIKFASPVHPPFTGRWGWLESFVFQALGSNGMVLLYVAIGTSMLFTAARPSRL